MKKLVGLTIAALALIATLSTPLSADGGAPLPTCAPWQCVLDNVASTK